MNPELREERDLPEVLNGKEVAALVEPLFEKVDINTGCHLVDSNVVLTLAGLKPQTEFFIDADNTTEEAIKEEIEALNSFAGDKGIQFFTVGKIHKNPHNPKRAPFQMVSVENLAGYERISKTTTIPGIAPFDKSVGWDGFPQWWSGVVEGARRYCQGDEVIMEELLTGFQKGYPEQAALDFGDYLKTGKVKKLVESHIPHTGIYNEAEPNYDFYPEHANDPNIIVNIEQSGKILEDFYKSGWHTSVEEKLSFHKRK